MDEGVQILELASNAQVFFETRSAPEKAVAQIYYRTALGSDGKVVATFRQRFDLLAETMRDRSHPEGDYNGVFGKTEIWLPGQGSNLRPID